MVANVLESEAVVDSSLDSQASAVPPAELWRKLPPSERDFEVFEHVVVGGGTTRGAAREFQISQTRVCQVLDRVRAWLDEVTPAAADEAVSQQQLNLAIALAADRLDFLYSRAMIGWNSSDGEIERTRISASGTQVTTRTTCYGDPRYLVAAGRLVLLRSKLATTGGLNRGMAAAADIVEGPLEGENAVGEFGDPPVGECSENSELEPRSAEKEAAESSITRSLSKTCVPPFREQGAARRAFFGPVQEPNLSGPRDGSRGHRGKESVVAGVPK